MTRRARRLRLAAVALPLAGGLLAVAWLSVLPAYLRAGGFRDAVARRISAATGAPARIASADLPDAATLVVRGLRLEAPVPGIDSIEIATLRVRYPHLAPFGEPVEVVAEGADARFTLGRDLPAAPAREFRAPATVPSIRLVDSRASGTVEGRPVSVASLRATAEPAGAGISFSVHATVDAVGPLELKGEAHWTPSPTLRLSSARFGDGLSLRLASLLGPAAGDPARLPGRIALEFSGGDGAWRGASISGLAGRIGIDGSAVRLDLDAGSLVRGGRRIELGGASLRCRAERRGERTELGDVSAVLPGLGTVKGEGSFGPGKFRLSVDTGELPLGPLLDRLRPWIPIDPSLAAEGTARVTGALDGGSLEAVLALRGATLDWGGTRVRGVSGEIPVAAWANSGPVRRGQVSFEGAELPLGIRIGPKRLGLVGRPDFLGVETPIGSDLWGGHVLLAELKFEDFLGTKPRVSALLGADRIDLAKLGAALGLARPPVGRLDIPGGRLVLTPEQATYESSAEAAAFGARISVKGLRASMPFDRERRILKAAFRVDGLRLREVLECLAGAGVVDGVLDARGEVDLGAAGRPLRLRLEAATRAAAGVPQELDLDALKHLARRLGWDVGRFDLLGLRALAYERLGVVADLDDGRTLRLRGRTWVAAGGGVVEATVEELRAGRRPPAGASEYFIQGAEPGIFALLFGGRGALNVLNPRPGEPIDLGGPDRD